MSLSDKFLMFFIVLLFVLLPGCSAGRQSSIYREMTTETQVVRTDSLLLQDLFQASRNKTIDIEHIVFDTSRPDTLRPDSCRIATRAPVHSVTHITIDDQGKIETKTSVKSGSVSSSRLAAADSLQKEHVVNLSSARWVFVFLVILLLLALVRLKSRYEK